MVTKCETRGHVGLIRNLCEAWNAFFCIAVLHENVCWQDVLQDKSLHYDYASIFLLTFANTCIFCKESSLFLQLPDHQTLCQCPSPVLSLYNVLHCFQLCAKSKMCDQMGHSGWCRSHWLYGWLAAPLLHRLQIRRDANWLGLQPRVHKQEAMKGFDMQPRTAQSGQARVWLQTAAFYIPQSVGFQSPASKTKMWRRMKWKKKSSRDVVSDKQTNCKFTLYLKLSTGTISTMTT